VGSERLKKGVGFVPYEFHEGLIPHGILTRRLKVSPQALDKDEALAPFVQVRLVSHGSTEVSPERLELESQSLAYIRPAGGTFTS